MIFEDVQLKYFEQEVYTLLNELAYSMVFNDSDKEYIKYFLQAAYIIGFEAGKSNRMNSTPIVRLKNGTSKIYPSIKIAHTRNGISSTSMLERAIKNHTPIDNNYYYKL